MPWLPEFVSAVELARVETRAAGLADPATQYVKALDRGDLHVLETVWPGHVVVHDPRRGEIRGHHKLHQYIRDNHSWFAARDTTVEEVATIRDGARAVLELVTHL